MGRIAAGALAVAALVLAFAGSASPAESPGPGITAAITITADPDSPTSGPGDQNGYTVTVHNPNTYPTDLCELDATLPPGFSYVSGSTSGFVTDDPGVNGQVLTWSDFSSCLDRVGIQSLTTIPAGGSKSMHFLVTVASRPGDYFADFDGLTSTDSVTPTGPTAKITVEETADLSLKKSGRPDPVLEGHLLTYTLAVRNAGPQTAQNVVLTDNPPLDDVLFVSVQSSQGTCKSKQSTVKCDLGDLRDGEEATVEVVVEPFHSGVIVNTAGVTSDTADPDKSNNSDSARTTVTHLPHTPTEPTPPSTQSADLTLTKTASAATVGVGQNVTYTLTVKNAGPGTATGVVVNDPLPAGTAFVSATPSQGTCSGTVVCNLGTLAAGAQATVTVVVTVTQAGTKLNTATVSSSTPDPVAANSVGSVTVNVQAPDVAVVKRASAASVAVGTNVTFTLTVTNNGPGTAVAVSVSDPLPAGLGLVSATPSQGSCSGAVTCNLGSLAQGASAIVTIVAKATKSGAYVNTAAVSSAGDPNAANDRSSVQGSAAPITGSATGTVLVNGKPYTGGPIPNGATVDVKDGKLKLQTDDGTFEVYGLGLPGIFVVQNLGPLTELRLKGGNFKKCSVKGLRTTSGLSASPPPKKTTVRRLFAKGKGKFRTRGTYASATVRGTFFVLSDRCDGTFTSVRQGTVAVLDLVKKKTVLVRAGKSYLAKKPG